jgi:YD repeat-containing protein
MRPPKWLYVPVSMAMALSVCSADKKSIDMQIDGFSGPVKSVSTRVEMNAVEFPGPDGPVVIQTAGCEKCDYDQDGNRIWSGQMEGTNFRGQSTRFIRDANGIVTERVEQNEEGQVIGRSVMGPFGAVEDIQYSDGQQELRRTFRYDDKGNVIEIVNLDPTGAENNHSTMTYDEAGHVVEEWDRGRNDSFEFHFVHTYDSKTHFETWTTFNENGSAELSWVLQDTKMLSYWQSGDGPVLGSAFLMDSGPRMQEARNYYSDGSFDRVESEFLDEQKRNVKRVERHSPTDELVNVADYEYEFDLLGNWTKRSVWVWTPGLGQRTLYETDYRTIEYWNK